VDQRGPVEAVRLELVTPLCIRIRGRYNPLPGFMAVTHALLRLLHLLWAMLEGSPAESNRFRPLALAERIRTHRAEFELFRWPRRSGRQEGGFRWTACWG
jgi:hypothetical protein